MTSFVETYSKSQRTMIEKLDMLQSELDIVAFSIDGYIEDIYSLCEQAALEGMNIFSRRLKESYIKLKREKYPDLDLNKVFNINIDANIQPKGKRITADDFIGIALNNDLIDIFDYSHPKMILAYALLEPPYGLHMKKSQKDFTQLYRSFVTDLLNINKGNKDRIIVYTWTDDWSNYFDAGKEWWGAYYWTVYNPDNHTIIVIGGSATD